MAFTMAELRGELQNLGYGSLPEEFIVSSLSQLQLGAPQSWDNIEKDNRGGVSSSSRAHGGGKSARQVHGDPVPGDREFAEKIKCRVRSKKELGSSAARDGGLDSVCFTPGFATEVDEMRKMLKIVHGTKEELFGSSRSTQRSGRKRVGLADEHKMYVGDLLDQWRVVGKTIRSKRHEYASADMGPLPVDTGNGAASNSENGGHDHTTSLNLEKTRRRWQKPQDASLESKILPPAEVPSTGSGGFLGKCDEDPQAGSSTRAEIEEQGNGSAEGEGLMGKVEMDHRQEEGTATRGIIETDLNEGDLQGVMNVAGNDTTGPVFTRQVSSSAISPGFSYQPGGMLYPENFSLDAYNEQRDLPSTNEETPPLSHHDAEVEEDDTSSPSHRSSAQTQVLDQLSAHPKDPFLAAFHQSLDDLDPRDIIEREKFDNVNQNIPDRTPVSLAGHPFSQQTVVEIENPLISGVPRVLIRTPDRRGGGAAQQSPLNDRSNLRIAVEVDAAVLSQSRTKLKKKTEALSPAALKRNSSVTLKRSRSSRGISRRNEIGEGANDEHPTDIVDGGRGDSHLRSENTTPPRTLRKVKSERVPRYPISEISPKVTIRNKGIVDESDLDIFSLGLSPVKIRELSVSPRNNLFSSRERSCVANGYTEHRLGSHCSACYPPSATPLRKSGDNYSLSTTSTSRSPVSRNNAETVLSDTEASPRPKRSSVKKEAAGGALAKQKLLPKKSSVGPSGIYTPLLDPKTTDVNSNSKVLLKTRRLASSMEFASDTSRLADRRSPSLRSSAESSKSSGPQRTTSSQSQVSKSLSGSSPYAKSSSFGSRSSTPKDMLSSSFGKSSSFGSSSTPKDTLTPGGPRRGGKVDRVARVLEEMRPSTEPPPFVVPTLLSNSEGVCIF